MAKKKISKSAVKKEIKNVVKTLVSKVEPKKRGRKPGTKFGSYKKKDKNILLNTNTENNETPIIDNSNSERVSSIVSSSAMDNGGQTQILSPDQNEPKHNEGVDISTDNNNNNIGNNSNTDESVLNEFIEKNKAPIEYKEVEQPVNKETVYREDNTTFGGSQRQLISGTLLLAFCDFIFPTVIIKLVSFADPNYKHIDKQKIKLTEEQKKDLEPAANEVAKYVFQKIDPLTAFLLSLTICYASNFMDAKESFVSERKKIIKDEVKPLEQRLEVVKNTIKAEERKGKKK